MQPIKLLAPGLLVLALLGSSLPTGAASSDQLILQQIKNYRAWNRVTPEIVRQIKELPPGTTLALAPTG